VIGPSVALSRGRAKEPGQDGVAVDSGGNGKEGVGGYGDDDVSDVDGVFGGQSSYGCGDRGGVGGNGGGGLGTACGGCGGLFVVVAVVGVGIGVAMVMIIFQPIESSDIPTVALAGSAILLPLHGQVIDVFKVFDFDYRLNSQDRFAPVHVGFVILPGYILGGSDALLYCCFLIGVNFIGSRVDLFFVIRWRLLRWLLHILLLVRLLLLSLLLPVLMTLLTFVAEIIATFVVVPPPADF